jgi:hypothetical protein
MSDLQLGLLALGVLVVGGVLGANFLQERRARRAAEQAFRSGHDDVLMQAGERREPTLDAAPRRGAALQAALPDERLDYVVDLALRQMVPAAEVAERWSAFEHRFAGRALLAASADRVAWRRRCSSRAAAVPSAKPS